MSINAKSEERILAVADGDIYVKIWKPSVRESDKPLLLLHDSLGCVEMWRDFPEKLAVSAGRMVIAYDRLGYGRSSACQKKMPLTFIEDEARDFLPEVLKAFALEHVDLFGHSVGGAMAIEFAARDSRVHSVVSESAQPFVETRTRAGIEKSKKWFSDPENFERLRKYHGDKAEWVLDSWTETWLSKEFSGWNLRSSLPKVTCPLLVIHGENDEYGSIAFPETLSDLTGGSSHVVIVPGCGHVPHREQSDLILQVVNDFYIEIQ